MDYDQSNNEARSSESITKSPAPEYDLVSYRDVVEPESSVSRQGYLGSEPTSQSQEGLESSSSLSSHPLTTISLASCPPTSDLMDCDQSNNEDRSSEPIIESLAQGYVLISYRDLVEPESSVPRQGYLGSEPTSQSQEGLESSVAMPIHSVINHDLDQMAGSFPRNPTFRPANMVSEECSYRPQSDESGQESREQPPTAEHSDSQQPQLQSLNGSSGYSGRESNMAQTWDAPAGHLSSVDDQRWAGAEENSPWNHLKVVEPVLDQGPCESARGITFGTLFHHHHGKIVPPPLESTTLPLPEIPSPRQNEDTNLPWTTAFPNYPQAHGWPSRPYRGHMPNIYETRRLERTANGGLPLVQGPTHFGPPMKPFDGAEAETVAIDRFSHVVREREKREREKR